MQRPTLQAILNLFPAKPRRKWDRNTGYTQNNGAVSKVNKKFISHLTRAQRTPSAAAATVQVYHVRVLLSLVLQQRWIGRAAKGDNHLLPWPPRSPDLTP